jgi:hypothetical protein
MSRPAATSAFKSSPSTSKAGQIARHTCAEPLFRSQHLPHFPDEVRHDGAALLQRRFLAEVAVEAQEIEFQAVEVVVLTEFADQRELLRTHLGHREVMHEVRTAQRAGLDAMLGMLRVKLRHAHADAAARFVAGLRIDELLVMRVVHAQRDEGRLSLGAAAVDEDLHHIAAIQHELAEGVRLLP